MAFGKRIKFFRNRKGMKQKELGELLGFLGKTSDVRVAQYETEARTPKADLVKEMAQIFDVSTRAINEYQHLFEPFHAWQQMAAKLEAGEISQEEYDNWRYNYPELDTFEIRAKVPSLKLSDELIKALKKENQ